MDLELGAIVRAEVRKYLARKAILALLGLMILLCSAAYWSVRIHASTLQDEITRSMGYASAANERGEIPDEDLDRRLELLEARLASTQSEASRLLRFPRSLQIGAQVAATAGALFVVLIAALAFGSEFSWRTQQHLLAAGRSRTTLIAGEFLGVLFILWGAVVVICAITGLSGLFGRATTPVNESSAALESLLAIIGALLAVTFWASVGLLVAILSKSVGGAITSAVSVWVLIVFASVFLTQVQGWLPDYFAASLTTLGSTHNSINGLFVLGGFSPLSSRSWLTSAAILLGMMGVVSYVSQNRFANADLR